MQIPPFAPVSVWKMIVHTARKGVAGVNQHQIDTAVYVLFNPWCPSELYSRIWRDQFMLCYVCVCVCGGEGGCYYWQNINILPRIQNRVEFGHLRNSLETLKTFDDNRICIILLLYSFEKLKVPITIYVAVPNP